MPPIRRHVLLASLLSAVVVGPAPALAQTNTQTPPTSIPGLERFSLPGSPTPAPTPLPTLVPPPVATPTPAAPVRPAPAATPAPRATPSATPTPAATAAPTASPTPAPTTAPAPVASTTTTPMPEPMPSPAPPPQAQAAPEIDPRWWLVGGALALLGGWLALRRRTTSEPAVEAFAPAEIVPPPPPSRARLAIELRPSRAGLNLLSATVDCEVRVTNIGDAPAERVRVAVRLFSAHAGQDAELAAFHAQPAVRPVAPPFALAPGESRAVRAVAALPHADIRPLDAAGRPMFVPVLAVNALYDAGQGVEGRTAQAFVVGIERVDSPKLAPFWLDQPPRTVTEVAARAHGAAIETDQPR